jgi:hypothetical protein
MKLRGKQDKNDNDYDEKRIKKQKNGIPALFIRQ